MEIEEKANRQGFILLFPEVHMTQASSNSSVNRYNTEIITDRCDFKMLKHPLINQSKHYYISQNGGDTRAFSVCACISVCIVV